MRFHYIIIKFCILKASPSVYYIYVGEDTVHSTTIISLDGKGREKQVLAVAEVSILLNRHKYMWIIQKRYCKSRNYGPCIHWRFTSWSTCTTAENHMRNLCTLILSCVPTLYEFSLEILSLYHEKGLLHKSLSVFFQITIIQWNKIKPFCFAEIQ